MDSEGLLPIALDTVILECADAAALANFYIRLLGWRLNYVEENEWVELVSPSGGVKLAFQQNGDYIPPVWPESPGAQQSMAHLDFAMTDRAEMAKAVRHALSCGAVKAGTQYDPERWITLFDPAGHPFCFVVRY